ncbi:DUF6879 family protein [Kribbella sp. NPDC056951]|uniref:DUF6879 domain-containing protein n=1 Tax=Kribbella yunnanensis TaxID=190194 RepID=A0ABN2HRM2_9ACTN
MLPEEQVDAIFEGFSHSAFRLETLDYYHVGSDGGDVARYLAGAPEPDPDRKGPWLNQLRAERAAGKLRHRVHVLRTPLSDYLRYECEWGYLPNAAAGEEIHILDLSEHPLPTEVERLEDFWLMDDETVLRMHYDELGVYLGASLAEDVVPYRRSRDAALAASTTFGTWWSDHPEYWRANQQESEKPSHA